MDDLVQFLHARYDEDEQAANEARLQLADRALTSEATAEHIEQLGRWDARPWLFSGRVETRSPYGERIQIATVANLHIARHDPARVLAEVDAKRRILLRCEEALLAANPMLVHFAQETLREMALPYADHPDWGGQLTS